MESNNQTPRFDPAGSGDGTRTGTGTGAQPGVPKLALDHISGHEIQIQIMMNDNNGAADSISDSLSDSNSSSTNSLDDRSDCESGVTDSTGRDQPQVDFESDGLVRIQESNPIHRILERKFISGLGPLAAHTSVVAIHRRPYSSPTAQATLRSFRALMGALEQERGGNPNLKCAWAVTSRDEMASTLSLGFGHCPNPQNDGLDGSAIYLSPENSSIDSVRFASVDRDGLRHVLLCRVLLGNTELVRPGSGQFHPSSEAFDSGVDRLDDPRKYIVWRTHMNTHILPECVISLRAPVDLEGFLRIPEPLRAPRSPWIPFPSLIVVLSRVLSPMCTRLIARHHKHFLEGRIPRQELIRLLRRIAGDKLLIAIIHAFRARARRARDGSQLSGLNSQTARATGGARKHHTGLGKSFRFG